MKLAASEAQWDTSDDPASFTVAAHIDTEAKENTAEIKIPGILSFFAFNEFSGSLEGINQLQEKYVDKYGPGNYVTPVKILIWSFRSMVGSGGLMLLLSIIDIYVSYRNKILHTTRY